MSVLTIKLNENTLIPVTNTFAKKYFNNINSISIEDNNISNLIDIKYFSDKLCSFNIFTDNLQNNEIKLKFSMLYIIHKMDALKHKLDIHNCINLHAFVKECSWRITEENNKIYEYDELDSVTGINYHIDIYFEDKYLNINIIKL